MSRELDAALEAEIEKPVVRPFMAIFIDLPDAVRAWTGQGTLSFPDADGITRSWIGAGGAPYSIDAIGEATDGSATGVKVALAQIPEEFRDDIADQATRGATFEIYVGALNETFQEVVATNLIWRGRVDDYRITDAGTSITVEITGESRGIDQRRPSVKRMTHEWQQRQHPGDDFFEYVPRMAEVTILWAAASQNSTATGGGGNTNYVSGGGSSSGFGNPHAL